MTQFARPNADVSDGAWTPSTGADNYAVLDESTASDADYSTVTSNSTLRVGLSSIGAPAAGTRTLRYRVSGSLDKKLIVRLIEGSTTKETFTHDPAPSSVTLYEQTVAASVTDYGDLDVEVETANATTPPTPTITFGAVQSGANGSTSITPSYPASITAGMYLTCYVTSGATNSETPTTPSGWTLLGTGASTDGTFGVDTGPRRATVFGKVADGTESGTLTVNVTNGNTCRATICRWSKANASYVWDVVGEGANDSTSDTSMSMTTAPIDWAAGDTALVVTCIRLDGTTVSAQSLTASGTTFGTRTNRSNIGVITGNDHHCLADTFAAVTVGGGSAATTWAYTASAATSGGGVIVRLREVPPTEKGRVTWVELETPDAAASDQTLTQSTRFDNANTFYAHTVTPGEVTLTQSTRFDNVNTFYNHTVTVEGGVEEPAVGGAHGGIEVLHTRRNEDIRDDLYTLSAVFAALASGIIAQ